MKKALQAILAFVCLFSLLLGCAETADGGLCLVWSAVCLLISFFSGWLAIRINPKAVEE